MKITKLITEFKTWIKNVSDNYLFMSPPRTWCLLGMKESLTNDNIRTYFNRDELNAEYVKRFNANQIKTKQATAMIKCEINYIYGFQKGFTNRHKSRLQVYRDDVECKTIRTWNAVTKSVANYQSLINTIEKAI